MKKIIIIAFVLMVVMVFSFNETSNRNYLVPDLDNDVGVWPEAETFFFTDMASSPPSAPKNLMLIPNK